MSSRRWSFLVPLLILLIALSSVAPVLTRAQDQRPGLDPADMDLTVDPRQDFYRFANGGWLDRAELSADVSSYGPLGGVSTRADERTLFVLLIARTQTLAQGSDEWKAVELFNQGMDFDTRNAQGISPIQPLLAEIDAISTLEEFHEFQRTAAFSWLTGLFWVSVGPGIDDSSINEAYLSGSPVGLPNRDYYLDDDAGTAAVREAYIATNARLLEYAGYDTARAAVSARAAYGLERALVEPTLTREETQNLALSNNPRSIAELQAIYPLMDWEAYMADLGLTGIEEINVTQIRYLEALEQIVRDTPLEVLKDFVKLQVMWSFADFLGEDVGQTVFELRSFMTGEEEPVLRSQRTLSQVNHMVGDAVGRLYVEEFFPPEAKAEATTLVESVIVAFRTRLEANTWMSPETKVKALEKLAALNVKVGYPDQWRTYEAVEIGDSYVESYLSAVNAYTRRNLARAGQPVDRDEWRVSPQTANAFYSLARNEIVLPAGILQAPLFNYQADPDVNYGAIGTVIGHEITHGFDLQGAQFDAEGNFSNWWTEEDLARFKELNQLVVDQYGAIELIPGLPVDGQFTVTENVADLGGIQVAYDALEVYLAAQGEAAVLASPPATPDTVAPKEAQPKGVTPVAPQGSPVASPIAVVIEFEALTPQQRFFVSAAATWRENLPEESLELRIRSDPHAPSVLRGTLPLRNMDEFHEAFGTEPGDDMYLPPAERIVIW